MRKDEEKTSREVNYGVPDMVSPLRSVLLRRPDDDFAVGDPEAWNYAGTPDLEEARDEHDQLARLLESEGVKVLFHQEVLLNHADSIFVFDPSLMTSAGAVILNMGKELRRGEEEAIERTFRKLGIPVVARLTGQARAEGGDLLRLDRSTLVAGRGFRTNEVGIARLSEALAPEGIKVISMDLPYFQGPRACLHLLSLVSLIDRKTAVVYPPLMPVSLWTELTGRGYSLIEVDDEEFLTMATNILTIRPGVCLMLEGNERTKRQLEAEGIEVLTYKGDQLSLKAEGGPTCLTLPLWREAEAL